MTQTEFAETLPPEELRHLLDERLREQEDQKRGALIVTA